MNNTLTAHAARIGKVVAIGGLIAWATGGLARSPLSDVDHVNEGLITAGMVIELADNCGEVSIRKVRGWLFLGGLKDHARDLGYTSTEINAYMDDKEEKARLEAIARERIGVLGVDEADPASYCAVAHTQIDQGTQIGRFLYVKRATGTG